MKIPNNRLFRLLCEPVVTALKLLGIESSFRPRNDIEVDGRKISGTGGTESGNAFLFQGTMLTDFDVDTMLRCLRIPVEKLKAKEIDSVKERVTCLKWELGAVPDMETIKRAIRDGFESHLGIRLEPGPMTKQEERLFREKLPGFQSTQWVDMVKTPTNRQEVVQSAYKNDDGLVRFTFVVDLQHRRVRNVFITGDFLSFPTRALYDMEVQLRGARCQKTELHGIIRQFFETGRIQVPGMSCEDFLKPVDQVLEKVSISQYGIPLEYCNLISVTNGSFEDVLKKDPTVLLLPYCAKDLDCSLRHMKGCSACGTCSVGSAWHLGKMKQMKRICIVSFEDLIHELQRMKARGVTAFIGCCCQPFFTKHVNDFEKAGLPGILLDIDNTTCYELDQAKAAYAGNFESQTHVNLDLLNMVLHVDVGSSPAA
ncbi:MAG: DUF116 domain-containing protein [Deltaproteobacteria bacterium]|nr:DUF116 domain-containing protein [Deltaproteobacteria bacterium]